MNDLDQIRDFKIETQRDLHGLIPRSEFFIFLVLSDSVFASSQNSAKPGQQ